MISEVEQRLIRLGVSLEDPCQIIDQALLLTPRTKALTRDGNPWSEIQGFSC